jgi:hypothetical protein
MVSVPLLHIGPVSSLDDLHLRLVSHAAGVVTWVLGFFTQWQHSI